MEDIPTGFLMAFLLPFHVGGGAALGVALRRSVENGFKLSGLLPNGFLLVWGAMFGGIPLIFGVAVGLVWLSMLQLGVFCGTAIGVAVGYEWLRDLYSQPGMFVATFGFAFLVIGAAAATSGLGNDAASGLLFGLVFGGVGGLFTLLGVCMLLRSR